MATISDSIAINKNLLTVYSVLGTLPHIETYQHKGQRSLPFRSLYSSWKHTQQTIEMYIYHIIS